MYIFLLMLGLVIFGAGVYIDREVVEVKTEKKMVLDSDLVNRVEALEAIIYSNKIEVEDTVSRREDLSQNEFLAVLEREKEQVKIDNMDIASEMKEKFKLVADYERGIYSLEEVCKLLDMKKGEVLLLKNLYKKY
ncbi:MAG: hypothetical protein RBR71_05610 [Gudongella sp.]|nr:hypothetical protein [Gudongella sp.]